MNGKSLKWNSNIFCMKEEVDLNPIMILCVTPSTAKEARAITQGYLPLSFTLIMIGSLSMEADS